MIASRFFASMRFTRTWRHSCVTDPVKSFRLWTWRLCSSVSGHSSNNKNNNNKHMRVVMEDVLRRTVAPVPNYETRDKSPPPPDSNSLDFIHYYRNLGKEQRLVFLEMLARDYGVDHRGAAEMARKLVDNQLRDVATVLQAEDRLRYSLTPRYKQLLNHISRVEGGVKFLVDLRADVLDFTSKVTDSSHLRNLRMGCGIYVDFPPGLKKSYLSVVGERHKEFPCLNRYWLADWMVVVIINSLQCQMTAVFIIMGSSLKDLNSTLKSLLSEWFSVGLLCLERITWQSPCELLQKISQYEAVHPVRNWTDIKRRVGPYRRCYSFTHASMPGEPLVVLHVALTQDISDNIQSIVREFTTLDAVEEVDKINAAIFYSISSTQAGLQGVELGNYLIKRVVRELQLPFKVYSIDMNVYSQGLEQHLQFRKQSTLYIIINKQSFLV
ncbi:malonyl-CoA decarboxylase, mitochondrial isoform X4 [Tachysurus fulvidraco]|uniref:malonyl-CoA decarboxylase, mitochondrial isoform X4 n=1 Tax=Tachysurus fulvidraco TaxID=1234273 RepID=UPI001FEDA853|nr:malonyl-CoA decarboxylase, mitochondrial isoform X4 [Tachysurus fulvidraco]